MKLLSFLLLARTVLSAPVNPDENRGIDDPDLFEGDMILTPEQRGYAEMGLDVHTSIRQSGSVRPNIFGLWPGGNVVYEVDPALAQIPAGMAAVMAGMDEWKMKTCITFTKRTNEAAYVYFTQGKGCRSNIGRTGGRQDIILQGPGCWDRGTVAHEIGHALGFFHEQSRPDRDDYVVILYGNIEPGKEHNFQKYPRWMIDSLGTPYDYRSVMHYEDTAFTKNGLITILVRRPGFQKVIGQRKGLSNMDAKQAELLYKNCMVNVSPLGTTAPPRAAHTTHAPGPTTQN